MNKMEIIEDKSIQELACDLYESTKDIDHMDYKDTEEQTINELIDALYHLKTVAQNEYNQDYFRTLWNCLQLMQL